jgi:hypothetical protein
MPVGILPDAGWSRARSSSARIGREGPSLVEGRFIIHVDGGDIIAILGL